MLPLILWMGYCSDPADRRANAKGPRIAQRGRHASDTHMELKVDGGVAMVSFRDKEGRSHNEKEKKFLLG
jgi:hypothetical protein